MIPELEATLNFLVRDVANVSFRYTISCFKPMIASWALMSRFPPRDFAALWWLLPDFKAVRGEFQHCKLVNSSSLLIIPRLIRTLEISVTLKQLLETISNIETRFPSLTAFKMRFQSNLSLKSRLAEDTLFYRESIRLSSKMCSSSAKFDWLLISNTGYTSLLE